jgi:hypothetical protein
MKMPVSRPASGEIRQNYGGPVRLQGIGNICRSMGNERVGQLFPAQVLADLQGNGPVRKEAFLLT